MPRTGRAVCVLAVLASALAGFGSASAPRTLRADVFVAGAGPAGFVAAIAAARNGAKVTLAESFSFPGGMATAGLVGPISKFNFAGRRVVGGIPWEFVERLEAAGGAITDLPKGNVPFEAEVYRRVAREMLEEAGVTCLWQTQVCGEPELAADGSIAAVTRRRARSWGITASGRSGPRRAPRSRFRSASFSAASTPARRASSCATTTSGPRIRRSARRSTKQWRRGGSSRSADRGPCGAARSVPAS